MNIQTITTEQLRKMRDDQEKANENDIEMTSQFTLTEIILELTRRNNTARFPVTDCQDDQDAAKCYELASTETSF